MGVLCRAGKDWHPFCRLPEVASRLCVSVRSPLLRSCTLDMSGSRYIKVWDRPPAGHMMVLPGSEACSAGFA